MANNTPLTIIGNLTAPPELRFTQNGIAVASFTIASTPRTFNRQTQEWEDADAMFMRCSAWREMAENIAESFPEKGARVIAQGHLVQRSFTDREGNNRTSIELDVQEIGPSLKYATAKPNKVDRRQGGGRAPQGPPQGGYGKPQGTPQPDPWAGGGNQGGFPDDPPW